jgi:hypothetical protein
MWTGWFFKPVINIYYFGHPPQVMPIKSVK